MNIKPSICFVAYNAYGAIANLDTDHVGGIETQQGIMAKWFADRGYDVTMITWDEGYEDGVVINGVKLLKMCSKNDGVPGIRFVFPRWSSLIGALKKADADIYYYNCGDMHLGQIALWTTRNNRKLFYSVANEIDCYRNMPVMKKLRERILYRYGIYHSDIIVVQTEKQKTLLKHEYGLDSMLIRMPCVRLDPSEAVVTKSRTDEKHVLWVSRFSKEKRMEWLLDIAEKNPTIIFDILGNANTDDEYSRGIVNRAEGISNVILHGRVVHDDIYDYYMSADLFCSTALYEGFPNTFLEAWSLGLPVVTYFDPDDVVKKYRLGFVASDKEEISRHILTILHDDKIRDDLSGNAKRYVSEFHELEVLLPKFEAEFIDLYTGQ